MDHEPGTVRSVMTARPKPREIDLSMNGTSRAPPARLRTVHVKKMGLAGPFIVFEATRAS